MEHQTSVGSAPLRLGQVGSSLAINKGQSEEWHFDRNDDDSTYSIISVFGSGGWTSSAENRQGWLVLPQLNIEVEMPIGSVVFFQGSHLLHYVRELDEEDADRRLVVTAFACSEMSKYYEKHKHEIKSTQVVN
ncbi:hypothetical protein M231_00514 [Tremella mesenterica]|uniref:Prolyl 4-hydroxylase alpha subunit Fe(2+) 2OG dioxygenase domain-containing protein n=1 Tax=Tremella mesenterica TaxID=5217 RepID=A0A4V1M502_TREME|nr:hypothetical protein M231_00514 [Tremella mesenterica]